MKSVFNRFNIAETLKVSKDNVNTQLASISELKGQLKTTTEQCDTHQKKIKTLEGTISKQLFEVFMPLFAIPVNRH